MSEIKKITCRDGETFTIGDMEFIKFPSKDGRTPVVMKDIVFRSRFGKNNDLRSSEILKRMQMEVLPRIIEAVGDENVCEFETDLTTFDGLKPYAPAKSRISLPTMDFYREYVDIFDKHNPGAWWWLATPFSVKPNDEDEDCVLCVSPAGFIFDIFFDFDYYGVRPFCIFKSSIFES